MKAINTIIKGLLLLQALIILNVSCKKDVEDVFEPDRFFKPAKVTAASGETAATLEWAASLYSAGKGVQYTIEISKDSLFQSGIDYSVVVDSTRLSVTDDDLTIKQKYFARVKANAIDNISDSKWEYSGSFSITGEQIIFPVLDAELKDKSVILRWRITNGLTKIVLLPTGGSQIDVDLDANDVAAGFKQITGLTANTVYNAKILAGTKEKGTMNFVTPAPSIFTVVLTPADDLVAAVNNAANGDVIGLDPGTYNCLDGTGAFVNLIILQKTITIQSVSGNPADTKVNYREITLKGTGAGITLKGIDFDGAAANATASQALYFLNLTGLNSDSEAATFTDIIVENCYVHEMGNCLFRGNRASNNSHKIGTMKFNNCKLYDCKSLNAYTFFTMEKLQFEKLEITNSTLYNLGRAFIGWSTNITVAAPPTILIDQCTINSFGRDARNNFFVDANANPVIITISNSIISNTPMPGSTSGTALMRATAATANMSYCNTFNLTNGASPAVAATFPAIVTMQNNKTIDAGWTGTSSDFTLPAGSELRTSSSSGGPVGDPRWAF